MGTSEEVLAASINLIVSIIIAIILVISLGAPWDFMVAWLGEQEIGWQYTDTVAPLFGAFYSLVLLWVVTGFIWFIKTVIKRTEYSAGYDGLY